MFCHLASKFFRLFQRKKQAQAPLPPPPLHVVECVQKKEHLYSFFEHTYDLSSIPRPTAQNNDNFIKTAAATKPPVLESRFSWSSDDLDELTAIDPFANLTSWFTKAKERKASISKPTFVAEPVGNFVPTRAAPQPPSALANKTTATAPTFAASTQPATSATQLSQPTDFAADAQADDGKSTASKYSSESSYSTEDDTTDIVTPASNPAELRDSPSPSNSNDKLTPELEPVPKLRPFLLKPGPRPPSFLRTPRSAYDSRPTNPSKLRELLLQPSRTVSIRGNRRRTSEPSRPESSTLGDIHLKAKERHSSPNVAQTTSTPPTPPPTLPSPTFAPLELPSELPYLSQPTPRSSTTTTPAALTTTTPSVATPTPTPFKTPLKTTLKTPSPPLPRVNLPAIPTSWPCTIGEPMVRMRKFKPPQQPKVPCESAPVPCSRRVALTRSSGQWMAGADVGRGPSPVLAWPVPHLPPARSERAAGSVGTLALKEYGTGKAHTAASDCGTAPSVSRASHGDRVTDAGRCDAGVIDLDAAPSGDGQVSSGGGRRGAYPYLCEPTIEMPIPRPTGIVRGGDVRRGGAPSSSSAGRVEDVPGMCYTAEPGFQAWLDRYFGDCEGSASVCGTVGDCY